MQHLAATLEPLLADSKHSITAAEKLAELQMMLTLLISDIKSALASRQQGDDRGQLLIPEAELEQKQQQLLVMLREFDTAALDLAEYLAKGAADTEKRVVFLQIEKALQQYDFDLALDLVEKM